MINLDDIEIIDEFEDDEPAIDPRKRGPLIGKIQIVDQAEDWVAINKPAFVPSLPERGKYTAQSVQEWAKINGQTPSFVIESTERLLDYC